MPKHNRGKSIPKGEYYTDSLIEIRGTRIPKDISLNYDGSDT